MAGFVASAEVDELTYDFKPYGPEGTIVEPTATQIQVFRTTIAELFASLIPEDLGEKEENERLAEKITEYIGKDTTEVQQKILHAIAEVCSDNPSFDVLNELPYRHQQAFGGWISGVFLLPPAPTPATRG